MATWSDSQLASIHKMLNPESVAIVGATPRMQYGGRFLNAMLQSCQDRVRIYPVNPNYDEIMGVKAYPSVSELPEGPDLVGIVVPYNRVLGVLQESHEKGAKSAVIISAGFSERGEDDRSDLQAELSRFARESGLRCSGPNCLGLANVRDNIWASSSSRGSDGLTGPVGLICQSGASAFGPFLTRAVEEGIGLSHIISTGNEADLDFCDFARYLLDDDGVKVIAGFVEGFKDARKFTEVARLAAERGKPIVLIKIGRSDLGARAAQSHTAALTGSDAVYDEIFAQYGVTRVQDYDELLEVSHLLANLPKPSQKGVAVVSHSGGISSLTADMCGQAGLDLPLLTDRARDGINGVLKGFGWAANPSDVTGFANSESFPEIMDFLISEPTVGNLVVASAGADAQAEQVIALRDASDKGVAFLWTGTRGSHSGVAQAEGSRDTHILRAGQAGDGPQVPAGPPRMAGGTERGRVRRRSGNDRGPGRGRGKGHRPGTGVADGVRGEAADCRVGDTDYQRRGCGIGGRGGRRGPAHRVPGGPESELAGHPAQDGGEEASGWDWSNRAEVSAAFDEIMEGALRYDPQARVEGVLVQEMVSGGVEVIAGINYDAQLGPVVLFGTGGVMVEVYNDVAVRHCPITKREALEMIHQVKGVKLLQGFRGAPEADIDALADTLVRVSQMAVTWRGNCRSWTSTP